MLRGEKHILVVTLTKSLQHPIIIHRSRVLRVSCLHGSHIESQIFGSNTIRRSSTRSASFHGQFLSLTQHSSCSIAPTAAWIAAHVSFPVGTICELGSRNPKSPWSRSSIVYEYLMPATPLAQSYDPPVAGSDNHNVEHSTISFNDNYLRRSKVIHNKHHLLCTNTSHLRQ